MLIKSYKNYFFEALSTLYDEKEIESFFYIITEHLHQKKRIDIALNPNFIIDDTTLQKWENILNDLKNQKPIQYIIGETHFYGLPFLVNPSTLIPRPETEELVDLIIKECNNTQFASSSIKILDIGTGSGCIAISLAKNLPNAQVFALDVSQKAIEVAQKNAEKNAVKVNFILVDILKTNDLQGLTSSSPTKPTTQNLQPTTFDIIVSNPPYVRMLEKTEIKPNVLDYEPHLALFVEDNDALLFYRKIAQLAQKSLTENGKLFFEINQYLGKETIELLKENGFKDIFLKKDIYENDRMLFCKK